MKNIFCYRIIMEISMDGTTKVFTNDQLRFMMGGFEICLGDKVIEKVDFYDENDDITPEGLYYLAPEE
mgnify:FL=1